MASSLMDNLLTDEAIKRRLLVDGDGVGDDRRILALMKNYVQFCTTAKDLDQKQIGTGYRRILTQLHQVEMSLVRTDEMIKVNEDTRDMFIQLGSSLRTEVEETKGHISAYKKLLEDATKHRKHAMEYDALARLIHSQPDRKGTEANRDRLLRELHDLKSKETILTHKLNARRQNMTILAGSIERLKDLVNDADSFTHPNGENVIHFNPEIKMEGVDEEETTPSSEIASSSTSSGAGPSSIQGVTPMDVDPVIPPKKEKEQHKERGGGAGGVGVGGKTKGKQDKDKLHEDLSESEGEQGN